MIKTQDFVSYLYNRLPTVYREEDSKLGSPFYQYLQSLCSGGYNKVIEDSNDFLNLVDPEKCPVAFFPYLYESFGLEYYEDIPIEYHRKFLSNIGGLMKRRGTNTAVRYLVSTLTGYDVDLSYERRYNSRGICTGRFLNVAFLVESMEEATHVTLSAKVIEQFIQSQVPFYITPTVTALLSTEILNSYIREGGLISSSMTTKVYPFDEVNNFNVIGTNNYGAFVCFCQRSVLMPQL